MNDEKWNEHFNVNDEEWKKICEQAIDLWDKLDVVKDPNFTLETKTCPMHPYQFLNLSNVSSFNKMNGYTYKEYVENWKKKLDN